jgi:oxalate decarboxylase
MRGALGASSVGPRNVEIDRQNPDLLASPDTDYGSIPNLKFSFSLAHNRLLEGGWAREVTIRELPAATTLMISHAELEQGIIDPVARIVVNLTNVFASEFAAARRASTESRGERSH